MTIALLAGLQVAGQSPAAPERGADQPPAHDPIRIEGDQDLLVPPPAGDDDGVRRGTGTADDPFVIENWTIEHPETEPAILVQGTTLHLVIQNVRFDGQTRLARIGVENAENVTIRRLDLDGPPNGSWQGAGAPDLIWGTASDRTSVEDLNITGAARVSFGRSQDVRLEDLDIRGWSSHLALVGGTYELRRLIVDNVPPEPGSVLSAEGGSVQLVTSREAPDGVCSLDGRDISIRGATGPGFRANDPRCEALLRDVEVTSSEAGVLAEQGAHVDLADATLRYIHTSRDPPSPGYRHGVAGLRADFEFNGGAGSLAAGENAPGTIAARNVTVDGYWHGVTSRGGGFDLEDVRIQGHRIGVYASGTCDPCEIHDSAILGSREMHVLNEGSSTVDARRNWWGSPDGPPSEMIEGDVLVEPWKTEGPAPPAPPDDALSGVGVVGVVVAAFVVVGLWGRRRAD